MSILITGACGYIGSHIFRQLAEQQIEAIGIDSLATGSERALILGQPCIFADFADEVALNDIFKKNNIDAVIHLAASTVVPESLENPLKYYSNNTLKTLKLLEKCVEYKVNKFIFSSTAAVYGAFEGSVVDEDSQTNPINPYGLSKLMSEKMIQDVAKAYGLNYVILRYFNVAGADPLGRIGQMAKKTTLLITVACEAALGLRNELQIFGTDYPTPDGTCIRDYIHVEDLADAHLQALNHLKRGGESLVLNVGYGRGYSVREVLEIVKEVSGKSFRITESPRRAGDPPVLIANNERIVKHLDWKPKFNDLLTIVQHAYQWEKSKVQSVQASHLRS